MVATMPKWAKEAKKALIDKDMTITDLADALGMNRVYLSSVINGRVLSTQAKEKILSYLDLPEDADEPL